MFLLTGDVKYYDLIERTLYNGLISGISLEGDKFFYPNPLESDGTYPFNQGSCTRQAWFDCSCCPTNLIRFIPSVPNLIYATGEDSLYINLYMSNEADIEMKGLNIHVTQETEYPWEGKVNISVSPEKSKKFTFKLRIPGWSVNDPTPGDLYAYTEDNTDQVKISVNGNNEAQYYKNGYMEISRKWSKGDQMEVHLPMRVRHVVTNNLVKENQGLVALEYGPMVYCAEETDNNTELADLTIADNAEILAEKRDNLLGGIKILKGNPYPDNSEKEFKIMMVPYYVWSNRGIGKMKVWFPRKQD